MAASTEVTRSLDCNIERSPGRDRILVAVSARSFCRAIHRMALPSIGFKQGNDEVLCKGDLTSGSLEFNNHSLVLQRYAIPKHLGSKVLMESKIRGHNSVYI